MKKQDLMIGDWVRIAPYDIIDQVDCLLTEYAVTSHGDSCGQYDYKDIEPIHLTPEILEKNGFSRENSRTGYIFAYSEYRDNKGDFDLYICNGVRKGSTCEEINEFQFTAIRYVHELQHALKLCGIEREIVL